MHADRPEFPTQKPYGSGTLSSQRGIMSFSVLQSAEWEVFLGPITPMTRLGQVCDHARNGSGTKSWVSSRPYVVR